MVDLDPRYQDAAWGGGLLREIALFSLFNEAELTRLYKLGRILELKPKAHAVIEGEATRGLYMLLKGRVSIYKNDPATGTMLRLVMLEEGAAFGELSLFDDAPRSATVAADSACVLFQLNAEEFEKFLVAAGRDLQVRFFKTCAEEMAVRLRRLNADYVVSQQLLWKHALRKGA